MGEFQNQLDEKVGDHPVIQFQNMASLDDQDNFAQEFAELINTLSTNIVIPESAIEDYAVADETKEEAIKRWTAKHSDGDDTIYTEIGGEMKVAKPTTSDPSGPEDINIKRMGGGGAGRKLSDTAPDNPGEGEKWVDTSYKSPATKVWDGDQWLVTSEGSNLPPKQVLTGGTKTFDVSDADTEAQFTVIGQKGDSTFDNDEWEGPFPGGEGGRITATVDLSSYDTIQIDTQYQRGGTAGYSYSGADGGDSAAVLDGNGNVLIAAGGGGGASGEYDDGLNGGGPNGGRGGYVSFNSGADGGGYFDSDNPHIVVKTETTEKVGSTEIRAFTNSPVSIESGGG